jgi:16S rRNA (guanine527-N7)-methyltransferase
VPFAAELAELLPADLPNRDAVVAGAARHLERIVEVNQVMNLTRIVTPREAALKHVVDAVMPWRLFAGAGHVVDAGTGPGFPGIPLALALPETRFTLLDSTQKKARFVETVAGELGLENVAVAGVRVEDWLKEHQADIVTGRAVAPLEKALGWFAGAARKGARVLLYKGPDADAEIAAADGEAKKRRLRCRVVSRYELPEGMGARTIVEVRAV